MSESPPSIRNSNSESNTDKQRLIWSRWYARAALKLVIFLVVTFFVLFPYPGQFARHLSHVRNLDAMIEPEAPRLAALQEELVIATSMPQGGADAAAVQKAIEKLVLERVKYVFDWDQWGSADYMPTVEEMFERADANGGQLSEDCDGRAVMAASLMRRMGYDAELVTDLRHVWVKTSEGEWMGPGGEKTMTSTAEGTRIDWGTLLANIPISLSFGIAVFPFWREMVILVTVFVLMLNRGTSPRCATVGFILLLQGLLFMRLGFFTPGRLMGGNVSSWPAWVGLLHIAAGFIVVLQASRRAANR